MGSVSTGAARHFDVKSIAIIGAGPSGVAAAKYLRAENAFNRITIFEQRSTTGGIWNLTPSHPKDSFFNIPNTNPNAGLDKPIWQHSDSVRRSLDGESNGEAIFMSPLYERLETNIPRTLMRFSDFDFPVDAQLFPTHETVTKYLDDYAEDVKDVIVFGVQVLDVRLVGGEERSEKWRVKTKPVVSHCNRDAGEKEEIFDAVVVANGHYDVPYVPDIKGIREWDRRYPGVISHSKYYRRSDEFKAKKVVVVGNSASGLDIGSQIAQVCRPPLLQSQRSESYLSPGPSPLKLELPEITEFLSDSRAVRFANGRIERDIDAILFCTGYFYSFPFMQSLDPPLTSTGERTENLYRHVFYRPQPTLVFLTLLQKVIPFPLAEAQAAVVARVWSNRLQLPDEQLMRQWEEGVVRERGKGKEFHVLSFPRDADYINELHDWSVQADDTEEAQSKATKDADGAHCSTNGTSHTPNKLGKTPPRWGPKQYWLRERFPAIKKAFTERGEGRRDVRSVEELGFDFESWSKENCGKSDDLLRWG